VKPKREESGTPPIGQEAEVPDAQEAFGEQVQQAKEAKESVEPE